MTATREQQTIGTKMEPENYVEVKEEAIEETKVEEEVLKVETNNQYGEIYSSRGTFIGDTFYLLTRNGNVKSYDLETRELRESLIVE